MILDIIVTFVVFVLVVVSVGNLVISTQEKFFNKRK